MTKLLTQKDLIKEAKTLIRVDEKYNIIKKKTKNKKPLPNEMLDLIIPIFRKES